MSENQNIAHNENRTESRRRLSAFEKHQRKQHQIKIAAYSIISAIVLILLVMVIDLLIE